MAEVQEINEQLVMDFNESPGAIEISDDGDDDSEKAELVCDNDDTAEGSLVIDTGQGEICEDVAASVLELPVTVLEMTGSNDPVLDSSLRGLTLTNLANKMSSKRKRVSIPSVLDENDLEDFRVPFKFGWVREIVYRNTVDPSTKSLCDVYYFPPSGKKLRSMVDVNSYLDSHKDAPVQSNHFTFKRSRIYRPPHEIVRSAGRGRGPVKKVAPVNKYACKGKKIKISNDETLVKDKEVNDHTLEVLEDTETSTNLLTISTNIFGAIKNKKLNFTKSEKKKTNLKLEKSRDYKVKASTVPIPIPTRGRPRKKLSVYRSKPGIGDKPIQKKVRRLSPEWTPESDGFSSRAVLKNTLGVFVDSNSISEICGDVSNGIDTNDDTVDDYDDSDVLGAPSELIASIIRSDQKKQLFDKLQANVQKKRLLDILQANKAGRTKKRLSNNSFNADVPDVQTTMDNSIGSVYPSFIVTNSNNSTFSIESFKTPGGPHKHPPCWRCGQDTQLEYMILNKKKYFCVNCAQQTKKAFVIPEKSQKSLLNSASSSLGTHELGKITSPVAVSSSLSTTPCLSTALTKPLVASSQTLPQIITPLLLIPNQSVTTIPPPPPLARYDSLNFIPMPKLSPGIQPPHLQLGNVPRPGGVALPPCPPPLHAGSSVLYRPTIRFIFTNTPRLQAYPPSLMPEPTFVQPAVTTPSSGIHILPKTSIIGTQLPTKFMLVSPAPATHQPSLEKRAPQNVPPVFNISNSQIDSINIDDSSEDELLIVNSEDKVSKKRPKLLQPKQNFILSFTEDNGDHLPVSFGLGTTETSKNAFHHLPSFDEGDNTNDDDDLPVSFGPKTTELSSLFISKSNHSDKRKKTIKQFNVSNFPTKKCKISKDILRRANEDESSLSPNSDVSALDLGVVAGKQTNSSANIVCQQVDKKMARLSFFSSFRLLKTNFSVIMKIFQSLTTLDLLRASCVCKFWRRVALQPELWEHLYVNRMKITDWDAAAKFLAGVGVKNLKIISNLEQADVSLPSMVMWDNIQRVLPSLTCLENLFFDQVPNSVLDKLTLKMSNLKSIGAKTIIEIGNTSNAVPMLTANKRVKNMGLAIEAVESGVSVGKAAMAFKVPPKDLIHLTQTSDNLTSEEEMAVLVCCLRLSRMGFSVQKDTFLSRLQEMLSNKYATSCNFPISLYYNNFYEKNVPFFNVEKEVKSGNTISNRLYVHYSALQKLYNSLSTQTKIADSQVFAFDLKTFYIHNEPGFRTHRLVAVTVLSVTSACGQLLPIMTIWPKCMEFEHPMIFNKVSKRGLPDSQHVFQYFQKIRLLVQKRPIVIICNGNATLLSEELISSCVSNSVYLYCVPPAVAVYTFPGHHGGLLHILKADFSKEDLKCNGFKSVLLSLFKSKKKDIRHSTILSFSCTGAYPLNPKAPAQFQAVDVNAEFPRQPWRKANTSTGQPFMPPSMKVNEIMLLNESQKSACNNIVNKPKKAVRTESIELDSKQLKIVDKFKKLFNKKRKIYPGLHDISKSHKQSSNTQLLSAKLVNQAKCRLHGPHIVSLKVKKLSTLNKNKTTDNQGTSSVKKRHEEKNKTNNVLDICLSKNSEFFINQNQPMATSVTVLDKPVEDVEVEVVSRDTGSTVSNKTQDATQIDNNVENSSNVNVKFDKIDDKELKLNTTNDVVNCVLNQQVSRMKGFAHGVGTRSDDADNFCSSTSEASTGKGQQQTDVSNREELAQVHIEYAIESNSGSTEVHSLQSDKTSTSELLLSGKDKIDAVVESCDVNKVDTTEDSHLLKMSEPSSPDMTKCKANQDIRDKIPTKLSTGEETLMNQEKSGDRLICSPVTQKQQVQNLTLEMSLQISSSNNVEPSLQDVQFDHLSSSKQNPCIENKSDIDEKSRLQWLSYISLLDHDYFIKDTKPSSSCDVNILDLDVPINSLSPGSIEVIAEQILAETAPGEKMLLADCLSSTGTECCLEQDDVNQILTDNNVADTAYSQNCDNKTEHSISDDTNKNKHNTRTSGRINKKSNIETKKMYNNVKHTDKNKTESESSSSSESPDSSNEDVSSSESDDNRLTSDDDDDNSKCQMCMRATPPHSKDKIIDWVDCDENCGRWFHVICVARSQSKADTKHFVCPSCRCKR